MKCRHCGTELRLPLVDLGSAPPSNAYLTEQTPHAPEKWFPLRVLGLVLWLPLLFPLRRRNLLTGNASN